MSYLVGLDLGQLQDYTALSIVRQVRRPREGGPEPKTDTLYQVGHLERFELGTSYTDVARRVGEVRRELGEARLIVDQTGVGVAVVDLLREAGLSPICLWIHGGEQVQRDGARYRVPKRELAGVLQALMSTARLQVQPALPHAETLKAEMRNFKAKIDPQTGHDSYAADWREGDHDDLILSVAMACWYGEHGHAPPAGASASTTRPSAILRQQRRQGGFGQPRRHHKPRANP